MAALNADQVRRVFTDDGPRRWALFQVLNVTTGDTIDMLAMGFYRVIKQTAWMGATVAGVTTGTFTATTATAPASLSADSCYLLVDGIPV